MAVDTDGYSRRLRARIVDVDQRRLLVTRLAGSEQEPDISEPVNCGGLGRIRHFRRETSTGWPSNSLPIDPACAALGMPPADLLRAQVFQTPAATGAAGTAMYLSRYSPDRKSSASGWNLHHSCEPISLILTLRPSSF